MITDIDTLVPKDHLLRKIERVMDYEWLYERLDPYYNHEVGRPSIDPVVLVKMVLLQHLFGIPSLRQTYQRIQDTLSYRWFLGYGLLENIPHFATVSYAFCKRVPPELCEEIFEHILNKALNHRAVDPSMVFIDGTHIKASANKKKFQKEQVKKAAKVYANQLREEVNAEREALGKKPIEEDDDDESGGILRHTTTNKDGRRIYRSTPKACVNCPYKTKCGANEKGQKMLMTHIWQEHLDLVEHLRKTERGKEIYAVRKETIERVFADAKEKHAMRYTHHRGLPAVTRWVKLKFAARRLKKLATWEWAKRPFSSLFNILAFLCGNTSLCKRMSWCSLTG